MASNGRRRVALDPRDRLSGATGVPLPDVEWGTGGPENMYGGPAIEGEQSLRLTGLAEDYPWLFEPQDARVYAAQSAATSVAPAATVTLLNFTNLMGGQQILPDRMAGKITHFACDGTDLTNLVWTILIKGSGAAPINGIQWQWAPLTAPVAIPRPGIRLGPNDDIIVQARNAGGAIITGVSARIHVVLWTMLR